MDTSIQLGVDSDAVAPDGMEVRILAGCASATMAHFRLPGGVGRSGKAIVHDGLDELWYCLAGVGEMWLSASADPTEAPMEVRPGVSFAIPDGCTFQLRNLSDEPLDVVGVTIPPWPGDHAARITIGPFDRADNDE